MRLNVIVPLSRPSMVGNVRANFERQRFQNKRLVVVQNGPGLSACQHAGFQPDVLIEIGKAHQSAAKNTALEYLRGLGERYFATFDDDDYYGPGYLDDIAEGFSNGYEVSGKSAIYIRFADNRMLFAIQNGESCKAANLNGPTISGVITNDMPLFDEIRWGEDNAWLEKVAVMGGRFWSSSRNNFCWMRRGDTHGHTYRVTDAGLENELRAMGPVYDCGEFKPSVVDGVDAPARFDRMSEQELDLSLHPAVKFWEEQEQGDRTAWLTSLQSQFPI